MTPEEIRAAHKHFQKHDSVLAAHIRRYPPYALKKRRGYFAILVRSVAGQQLSMKAAAAIIGRVESFCGGTIRPENIHSASHEQLRALGLSNAKASSLKDLAERVVNGTLKLKGIDRKNDESIVEILTQVKGIGEWTAQMFLIFCLARPNVLPVKDLGIKKGIQRVYGLPGLPDESEVSRLAAEKKWSPYCSVASWYLWRSLEVVEE